jgi:protoporphyrinogen/coproporphyrinogen III oxidase
MIVGGGVSGLATAYFLGQLGVPSLLFEKSARLGGLIKTDFIDGCQLEAGPDSYIAAKPAVTELAGQLGSLGDQIISSNDKARRVFVSRRGRLVPMPKGMVFMVPAELRPALRSSLFSSTSKLHFISERFFQPVSRVQDVSVGQLVREHFGEDVLESVAEPLLSGVYGGDAASLSAESVLPRFVAYERKYGSLIKGVRRERLEVPAQGAVFRSFRGGMQSLTDTLAQAISSSTRVLHSEVVNVNRAANAWRSETGTESFEAAHLVLACPAHAAGRLLSTTIPDAASELLAIPYSSAMLVTLVFDRARVAHPLNGFGFLVPASERHVIAAATWINTKFPSRIPEGKAAIRAFIIGPEALSLLAAAEADLIMLVRRDLEQFMGALPDPLFSTVHKWPDSMPQYIVGHKQRLGRISGVLHQIPGIHLVGNAYEGVGIPDCVRLAKDAATAILSSLHL